MKNTDTQDLADLVQLALIAIETGETIGRLAQRFDSEVVVDDIGMRAVPAATARRFFTERAEQAAVMAERQRRRQEELANRKRPVHAGAPGIAGATALEAAIAAEGDNYMTPAQEFGRTIGNPTRELMDQALAEGQRRTAEKRRQAAERKRLAAAQEKAKDAKAKADRALKGDRS